MEKKMFSYKGSKTRAISFPLGGIGTGCIGLGGDGRLIDWEIYNKPNKGSLNSFSHFAIKAESGGKLLDARVIQSDLQPAYMGNLHAQPPYSGYGFGPSREALPGVPHFKSLTFNGEFPFAQLDFEAGKFPASLSMTAFNPFIPLNDRDSGIPAAFFEFNISNPTTQAITYTLAGSLSNPLPKHNLNQYHHSGNIHWIQLSSTELNPQGVDYGDLTLAVLSPDTSFQEYWFRGSWFDNLGVFWKDFTTPGKFHNRQYSLNDTAETGVEKSTCTLAAHTTLQPGQSTSLRFIISWNFPNRENYWNPAENTAAKGLGIPLTWKNYYATLFSDSQVSAQYSLQHWDRLVQETRQFKDALYQSTLPITALEAISANLAILKSPTVLRLQDGSFYGFEGCLKDSGCCEGSCTHVWAYTQAMPFLFPKLERSMRDLDYTYDLFPDGSMCFRLGLPPTLKAVDFSKFHPCADGQFADVMKVYRDWKISGDDTWLRSVWASVKSSLEFAWSKSSPYRWDPEKKGVLTGRQHHTLDMELFGPNSWLTGFYLGALKAAAEMADHLGETESAAEYRSVFAKGKKWVDQNLFNGEYYQQLIDLKDKSILESYNVAKDYWNEEHQEMKYQVGEGCGIDQVLAQWHACLYGLGDIFDPIQTKKALKSMYKYNFKSPMRDYFNPCRIFALNDESGLVICDYPEGRGKPVIPIPYAQETMTGFEYSAAILMIQYGLVKEGMKVVSAIRQRYDGEKRNPWDEIECGSNYARPMASYALLNAFSGFEFNMVKGHIGFNPIRQKGEDFTCFWSLASGWGTVSITPSTVEINVVSGSLSLQTLGLPFLTGLKVSTVTLGSRAVDYKINQGLLTFSQIMRISPDNKLIISY